LAAELIRRGRTIVLMTDARSGALNSAVFAGGAIHVLRGAGIAGRGALRAGKAMVSLSAGILQARGLLASLRPAAIVGFGGYPSVAPVLGARLLRRRPPIVLHEQNAVLGRANRFLSGHADRLALSFGETERVPACVVTAVTGNPVRPAIAALAQTGYVAPTERIRLLVLGGSLGARVFSDVVPAALRDLPDDLRRRIQVVQQCRAEDLDRVRAAYVEAGIPAELAAFFPDVAARLVAAHLVIARAGASTAAELAVVGRPSILVPLPGAIDDHQTANARALEHAGGAWVLKQPELTPAALTARLAALLPDTPALTGAAVGARAAAHAVGARAAAHAVDAVGIANVNAAARLADLVEALVRQEAT